MSGFDKPVLGREFGAGSGEPSAEPGLRERIRALMVDQPYAVLCTQGGGQPYGSVIAFAANQELNGAVFATPIATRKYRLLIDCDRVALVVDNRAGFPGDISRIDALTATGSAVRLTETGALKYWRNLLVSRHPHLHEFVDAPSSALFRIDIVRYLYVVRLQEVHQWIPPSRS